jgi:hypothetical protein
MVETYSRIYLDILHRKGKLDSVLLERAGAGADELTADPGIDQGEN